MEEACTRLLPRESEEHGVQSGQLLRHKYPSPKPSLTLVECKAMKEPKDDDCWVELTVDKEMAMVVTGKEDFTGKAISLLADSNTYSLITKDPTTKFKNNLSQTLRDIKNQEGLSDHIYRKVYHTSAVPPKFYGLSKIHKVGTPLRPIVSSMGYIRYKVAKELANIISPFGCSVSTPS